jgi:hypothetical protein
MLEIFRLRVWTIACILLVLVSGAAIAQGNVASMSDAQIRERMIKDSIANYSGSCPCPYNSARNGSRCGGRSAYSRPGGQAPLCYPEDISDDMVRRYRQRQ